MRKGLLTVCVSLLVACGGGGGNAFIGGGGSTGTGSTTSTFVARVSAVAVSVGSDTLVANGSQTSFIQAIVTDQAGGVMEGVAVTFSATAGTLSATSASTASDGVARVFLTSTTTAGTSNITVSVSGVVQQTSIRFIPGEVSGSDSSITANPGSIPADGSSTATVVVIAADANGNLVEDGANITLLTNAGTVTSTNPAASALGRAEFTLQAPSASGTGVLTVRVDNTPVAGLSQEVTFGTASGGEPVAVNISAAVPDQIFVREVGKNSLSQIQFEVRDSSGNAILESGYGDDDLENVRVSFVTRPSGGEVLSGLDSDGTEVATVDPAESILVRTNGGSHTVSVRSGTLPGTVELRVEVLKFGGTNFDDPNDVAVTASLPQLVIASGPPHTLVLTSPILNAIESLGGGVYRRNGRVIVTDQYGNNVPDDTAISLGYLDSVIAHSSGGATNGTQLTAADSLMSVRCTSSTNCDTAASFDFTSEITRNQTTRGVQENDRVLIIDAAASDKSRSITTPLPSATEATVQTAYLATESNRQVVIGAALSGGLISGVNADGSLEAGAAKTQGGIAEFRVTYPADAVTILNGCYGYNSVSGEYSTDDKRWEVPQSAQTWLVAVSNESPATAVSQGRFCFASIAGAKLDAIPSSVKAGSGDYPVSLDLEDGGEGIQLPFVPLSFSIVTDNIESESQFSVSVVIVPNAENNKEQTNINGIGGAVITIDGPACDGDKATVTFYGADAQVDVPVSVPVDEDAACSA